MFVENISQRNTERRLAVAERSFVSIVLVTTPQGIPCVRDTNKPTPHYWKLPGGVGEEGETPEQCGVREILEEVGVQLSPNDLHRVDKQELDGHDRYYFLADLRELPP